MAQTNLQKLEERMALDNIKQMLITLPEDVYYLSGFTGSNAGILLTEGDSHGVVFMTDGRYTSQSKEEVTDPRFNIEIVDRIPARVEELVAHTNKTTPLYLQPTMSASQYLDYSRKFNVEVDTSNHVAMLRATKSSAEIDEITRQFELAANAFTASLSRWQYGQTELEWAAQLEYQMKVLGARGSSFETIIASGVRSSLPHGAASSKVIKSGEPITVDFGSQLRYCSDITRQVYNGDDMEFLQVVDVVHTAMKMGVEAAKPGMDCSALDKVARDYITAQGYGEYFTHSLGHGVGLEIHEYPGMGAISTDRLEVGMVVTIEPGIYIPNKYGVRLEDTIVITPNGAKTITPMDSYIYSIN